MVMRKTSQQLEPSNRDKIRLAVLSLLSQAGYPSDNPLQRMPPFIAIGCADIGEINYCDAKANYTQAATELGYINRIITVGKTNSASPAFLNVHEYVFALEVTESAVEDDEDELEDAEDLEPWEIAEAHETRGTWHVGFAAAFNSEKLGIEVNIPVCLVGITDGVLDSGTLIEVRQSSWEWSGMQRNRAHLDKETQANIYSVMLGLKSWRCVFVCADGRFVTEGKPDEKKAFDDIKRAVRLRLGLEKPRGVDFRQKWKCVKGRCKFAPDCPYSPASIAERPGGQQSHARVMSTVQSGRNLKNL